QQRARDAEDFADGGRDRLLVAGLPVDEEAHATAQRLVELLDERVAYPPERRALAPRRRCVEDVLGRLLERDRLLPDGREQGVVREQRVDHLLDDEALLLRRVVRLAEPPVAQQREPGDGVIEVRVRRDGEDVARDLLRLLLDRALPLLGLRARVLRAP